MQMRATRANTDRLQRADTGPLPSLRRTVRTTIFTALALGAAAAAPAAFASEKRTDNSSNVLSVAASRALAAAPAAAGALPEVVPDELIVRFRAGTGAVEQTATLRGRDARVERSLPFRGMKLVRLPRGASVHTEASALERHPDVLYAEPNYVRRLARRIPNDPLFGELWGLNSLNHHDIDAPEAWDVTTGNDAIVVAVVDSGVAYAHPDLAGNGWTNSREIANGVDDDANGYVDDLRGWDFVGNDNAPLDENGHGTHVAGTIGAQGNNATGVVGVNWDVGLMPLRAADASGALNDADVIGAFHYAGRMGARVVNGSFGGGGPFPSALLEPISAFPNTLFVFAAGNGGSDGVGDDNDRDPQWPCNFTAANVICVAATDRNDTLASFSNFGATSVDLAAPGVGILSTVPGGYGWMSGTSMATPHVSGVAALLLAASPILTSTALRSAILGNVDPIPALAGKVATGGRLNAFRAASAVAAVAPPPPPPAVLDPPPVVNGLTCTVWPASDRDGGNYLVGTPGNDVICAFGGNDRVEARGGDDIVFGGSGDDTILGQSGADRIYGEGGNDLIRGGTGNDRIYGGDGDDRLEGGRGSDYLHGGRGADVVLGGDGSDTIVGGGGRDRLRGGAGSDRFYARDTRRDIVRGGAGIDYGRLDRIDYRTSVERRF